MATAAALKVGSAAPSAAMREKNSLGTGRHAQAQQVLDLRGCDEQGDAVGEAEHDGARDELDRVAEAGDGQHEQHHAGHHRDHQQARDAVLRDDAGDDDDEGPGRPADLNPRSAERRDDQPADDRGVDAGLRRHARRDSERHRERQRDDADGDAGDQVGRERLPRVALKRVEQARPPAIPVDGRTAAHAPPFPAPSAASIARVSRACDWK